MRPSITLIEWLDQAPSAARARLCKLADTPSHYLYQLSRGQRNAKADTAAAIEAATIEIHREHPELTPVLRTETCSACASCPFALQCKGGAK